VQITELILQTSQLDELTGFYSNLMELPVTLNDYRGITIQTGSTKLVFNQAGTAGPFYHFAINIPANKIEEAKAWLTSRVELIWIEQYKSDIADFVNWHAKSVYFYDPAGNIVELIARFDLANKTDEPFSSTQFLAISEVGLVIKEDELEKTAENLLQQYQLSYFDKQPPLPHFKALGDDEGLFIVVPEKRDWFPTTRQSGIFPMKIKFANESGNFEIEI
jgi:hypothetical protein